MRMATVTPLGAFPLIDYVIATSQNVGEGLTPARYLRLAEARSVPCLREDEEPIRVLLERCQSSLSAEFTVTLNAALSREKLEAGFAAPTRASATLRMTLRRWNRCSVVPCAPGRRGGLGALARCLNFRSVGAAPPWVVCSSSMLTRLSRGFRRWTVSLLKCAERWRRAHGGGDARISAIARDLAMSVRCSGAVLP